MAALSLVAAWWMLRTPKTRIEKWLHTRPSLVSFRTARLRTYLELGAIRLGIFLPDAAIIYVAMRAFRIDVPFLIVLAVLPVIIAAGGVPFTPTGLGPMQAVAVYEFAQYATTSRVLATFLALSVALLLYRLPLGLGSAGVYARIILKAGHPLGTQEPQIGSGDDGKEPTIQ
jgi:uncharacterized membrane protein YbhN (UPF0104 family)